MPAVASAPDLVPDVERFMSALSPGLRGDAEGLIGGLESRIEKQGQQIIELQLQLRLREEQLRLERIKKYGPKGEKLSGDQATLLELEPGVQAAEIVQEAALPDADKQLPEAAAVVEAELRKGLDDAPSEKVSKPRYATAHPGRAGFPAHLLREEVIIPCDEAPDGELIGYDIKEELVVKQAEFVVRVIKREKRRVTIGESSTIITAPTPPRIIEKGLLGDEVIIDLIVHKYVDHCPIYRQVNIWKRDYQVDISQATATRSVMSGGEMLRRLMPAMKKAVLSGPTMQVDETRTPVLQHEGKGKNDVAWLWQYSQPWADGVIYFDYQDNRSRSGPAAMLIDYEGKLQSDGYVVYPGLGQKPDEQAGCWAHVRRKFNDANVAAPEIAPCVRSRRLLEAIGELYAIEAIAREANVRGPERLAIRQSKGLSEKLAKLKSEIETIQQSALPASLLGKACQYAMGQWPRLERYASDGDIEIDNNWCENAMRPIALGRKNWMHLGSQESGPVLAAIMSVVGSAQRCGLNLRTYLSDVFRQLVSRPMNDEQVAELLPHRWKANHEKTPSG